MGPAGGGGGRPIRQSLGQRIDVDTLLVRGLAEGATWPITVTLDLAHATGLASRLASLPRPISSTPMASSRSIIAGVAKLLALRWPHIWCYGALVAGGHGIGRGRSRARHDMEGIARSMDWRKIKVIIVDRAAPRRTSASSSGSSPTAQQRGARRPQPEPSVAHTCRQEFVTPDGHWQSCGPRKTQFLTWTRSPANAP